MCIPESAATKFEKKNISDLFNSCKLEPRFLFPFAEVNKTSPKFWTGSWHNKQVIQYVNVCTCRHQTPCHLHCSITTWGYFVMASAPAPHTDTWRNGRPACCVRTCGKDLLPPSPKTHISIRVAALLHVHLQSCWGHTFSSPKSWRFKFGSFSAEYCFSVPWFLHCWLQNTMI